MNNRLLDYYQQELALAHQLAEEFAKSHPKIAGRLRLDGKNIADPETARLLQTFALSNAKLSYDLEDDFSFLSDTMLNKLHPHLYAPLPAFSIIQFEADPIKLNHQLNLGKHLLLQATTKNGESCFFRTCYDIDILPIRITAVELISKPQTQAFLRIRLEGLDNKIHLADVGMEKLRFFINLPASQAHKLYELIFNHCVGINAVSDTAESLPMGLSLSDVQPVGFQPGEEILPYHQATSYSYRLLTEFLAFPEKFLFFDVNNLSHFISQKFIKPGDGFELIFYLDQTDHELEKIIKPDDVRLFSTPVINLFEADFARIEIKSTQQKYWIPTDKDLEIYYVDKVIACFDDQPEKILEPLIFRKPCFEAGEYLKPGSETFLYFQSRMIKDIVDEYKNPQISCKALCTNRDLAAQLDITDQNILLHPVDHKTDVLKKISFLKKITPSSRPFLRPGLCWQYLSSLNPNYFSLTHDQPGLDALRNLLAIYMPDSHKEILQGILSLRTQTIILRSARSQENCFCQGIKISLQLDETKFNAIGFYLFCDILSYFLTAWFSKNITTVLVILSSTGKELYLGEQRRGER